MVAMIRSYFRDNPHSLVLVNQVEDAFNIGGPFEMTPTKRNFLGMIKRDSCPVELDFASAFHESVRWDPDSKIFAVPMCTDLSAGPGRR